MKIPYLIKYDGLSFERKVDETDWHCTDGDEGYLTEEFLLKNVDRWEPRFDIKFVSEDKFDDIFLVFSRCYKVIIFGGFDGSIWSVAVNCNVHSSNEWWSVKFSYINQYMLHPFTQSFPLGVNPKTTMDQAITVAMIYLRIHTPFQSITGAEL
jgi:hypothetical protein